MTEWITGLTDNSNKENNKSDTENGGFSIAPDVSNIPNKSTEPQAVETLTQLGDAKPTYEIKNVTSSKSASSSDKSIPSFIVPLAVIIPLVVLLTIGIIARTPEKTDETPSFIMNTLESKYFTMNYSPDYEVTSVVDKTVPFLEKHTLVNNIDGNKTLSIIVKNISFNYDIEKNSAIIARRQKTDLYQERPFNLKAKQGVFFRKKTENFEQLVVLVDRNQSILYEIMFYSTSNLASDNDLDFEFKELLESITFL